jgi:hypothetical protein
VWTGTSRERTFFNGVEKERVFENAFLEYGSMESMTRPTGRKMFFLTDPIEDWPRDWADYKKNYQATFAAQLLYPMIADYEVMPWPNRIYEDLYKTSVDSEEKERIPRFFSTQMQVMINTLNEMPLSKNKVNGSQGIGVLMSNSLMFQRFPVHGKQPVEDVPDTEDANMNMKDNLAANSEDPQFSSFYGQTLPLLKRGVPVSIVHLENVSYPDTWKDLSLLIMSYSNMKPMDAGYHKYLAEWVKKGGALVYCSRDDDAYQTVQEWWNTGEYHYAAPSDHLFEQMGIAAAPGDGAYSYGKGKVYVIRRNPKEFVLEGNTDESGFVNIVAQLYEEKAKKGKLLFKNNFYLERGPFDIIAVMDEHTDTKPFVRSGQLIDLFDPELQVLTQKQVQPGEQAFLFNIGRVANPKTPQVLASASRNYAEQVGKKSYSFVAKSPLNTTNAMRVLLPEEPKTYKASNAQGEALEVRYSWDSNSKTCFLGFENHPDGIKVELTW